MSDLSWRDAILRVLAASSEALHYTDIADMIAREGLRTKMGATPAASVNSVISQSLQNDGVNSPFIRVDLGRYWLREKAVSSPSTSPNTPRVNDAAQSDADELGLINALGMYWSRDKVLWSTTTPRILGGQQMSTEQVDFCGQKGVYLLHDGRAVIYVGRTTDQPLGVRLKQHTTDRLNSRWDRFSWFGVYSAGEDGTLLTTPTVQYDLNMLISTMEALLIEGLEPPQNRKRGDDFRAVEFLQIEDPEIERAKKFELLETMRIKLLTP